MTHCPCSKLPVPVILVNYDGFYGSLMDFLRACDRNGTVGAPELRDVVIAADNDEVCRLREETPSVCLPSTRCLARTVVGFDACTIITSVT